MRITIIGHGSIGRRHGRIAREAGHEVSFVTSQAPEDFPHVAELPLAISQFHPEGVIIANPTHRHAETLAQLKSLNFAGPILVEKPLAAQSDGLKSLAPTPNIFVAYNFRFHPVIESIKNQIEGRRVLSAQFYVGQHLSQWRKNVDYRQSYSAHAEQGGGALRDLSHELDLVLHLFGPVKKVTALGGKKSTLEITSEDVVSVLLETVSGTFVTMELNYVDRNSYRYLNLNTDEVSLRGNLIRGELVVNQEVQTLNLTPDLTFDLQLRQFAGARKGLCSLNEGLQTLVLIEAIEASIRKEQWINL